MTDPRKPHPSAPGEVTEEAVDVMLRLLEERAAGYGALRKSSLTAIALDRAASMIHRLATSTPGANVLAERAACAAIADDLASEPGGDVAGKIAARIRNRTQQEKYHAALSTTHPPADTIEIRPSGAETITDPQETIAGGGSAAELITTAGEVGREEVALNDCPPGLFLFNGHLGFKSEYTTTLENPRRYQCDAYVVASGEYFRGGASSTEARGKLSVRPLDADAILSALSKAAPTVFDGGASEISANRNDAPGEGGEAVSITGRKDATKHFQRVGGEG